MEAKPKRAHGRQNAPYRIYLGSVKEETDALWDELKAIALENDCVNRDGSGNISRLMQRIASRELIVKNP